MVEPNAYIRRPPAFQTVPACDCPQLVASPSDPTEWPWAIRNFTELKTFVSDLGEQAHESLLVFYLDQYFNLLAVDNFSDGDVGSVQVPIGRILCHGRQLGCKSLILVHNHPSGNPRPSLGDLQVTRKLCDGANAMDITLLEHVIVAGEEMRRIGFY